MRMPGWFAIPVLLAVTAGCDRPPPAVSLFGSDDIAMPTVDVPRARMPAGAIPAAFKLPAGNPPGKAGFPAVIVLHGCGGRGPGQLLWAKRLNEWGYAALIPDSMTPRGIGRVCDPAEQSLVTPRDRVGDVASAVAWLRTQPRIDPTRIAVLGFSHGGATAVMATDRIYDGLKLRAAINYYGPCVDPEAHGDVPLLVLAGAEDDWGHPALRCDIYGRALQPGQVFELHAYPGVYHAFDNPLVSRTVNESHIMEYNQPAAEDSYARVHAFLDRWDASRATRDAQR